MSNKRIGLVVAVFIIGVMLAGVQSVKLAAANACAAKLQADANAVATTGTVPFYLVTAQSTPIGRSKRNTVSYTEGRLSYDVTDNTLTGTGDQYFNDRRFTLPGNSSDSPFSPASVDRLRIDISLDNAPQITFTLLSWGNAQSSYSVLCDNDLLYGFMGDAEMYILSLQQIAATPTQVPTPTAPPINDLACSFGFQTVDASQQAAQVESQLVAAGITDVIVRAAGIGELCGDGHYQLMQADIDLTLSVPDLEDRVAIGNHLASVFTVLTNRYLSASSPDWFPLRQIKVTIQHGNQSVASPDIDLSYVDLWVKQGLRGAALLDAAND